MRLQNPKRRHRSRHRLSAWPEAQGFDNAVYGELGIVFLVGRSTELLDSGKDDLVHEFCQRIAPQFRIVMTSVLRAITITDVNLR